MKTLQSNGLTLIRGTKTFPGTWKRDPFHIHGGDFGQPWLKSNPAGEFRWSVEWELKDGNVYVYSGPVGLTAADWSAVQAIFEIAPFPPNLDGSIGEWYNYVGRNWAMIKMTIAQYDAWTGS